MSMCILLEFYNIIIAKTGMEINVFRGREKNISFFVVALES